MFRQRNGRSLPVSMPSTVISWVRYHAGARELEVGFTSGRRYLFHDVPAEAADAFAAARIKGRYFNRHIRGRFRFTACAEESLADTGN